MNDYDQAARFAARRVDETGMLRWLVGERTWAAWRWTGWIDSQTVPFSGEPDRRMDTVAAFERVSGDAPPLAIVFEFLTRPRAEVLERMAEYTLRVHREIPAQKEHPRVEYSVIGILVLLTGEIATGKWSMRPPDAEGLGLSAETGVRNLSKEPAGDVLAGVANGSITRAVLSWLPLMAGADDPAVVAEWARLATQEPDEERRASIGGLAKVFARLAEREAVWNPVLEGWNVERSPVIMEWEERGRLKDKRESLLRLLEIRFNQSIPADVLQAVQQQIDRAILSQWFDESVLARDMDAVRHVIGLTNGVPKQGG
jgi:hypothetical protein